MNILHVIGSLDQRSGGPLRAVLDLSAHSQMFGMRSELLGLGRINIPDNPLDLELIHSLPFARSASYGYSRKFRPWCRSNLHRFDAVMLHGMWTYSNWAVSRECLKAGIPYIYFPHGMLDLWSVQGQGLWKHLKKAVYWKWRERDVLAGSRAAFFTAGRELENARKTFNLPEMHPLIVIPYGMAPMSADLQGEPGANVLQHADSKVALFLGRVHPKKRPDLLIKAWKAAEVPADWRLVIAGAGDPAYVKSLSALARDCGVVDSVQFTGPVAGVDKQYLLRKAAWLLLPSEQENFGIVVLEAITNGCGVAISDQVYLADELPQGSEVLPVDLDAWTQFLRTRMQDCAWRDEIARRTTASLALTYDIDTVTRGWVTTIESVLRYNSPAELVCNLKACQ